MKVYMILHTQYIPPFGMGFADVEFALTSKKSAQNQMNEIRMQCLSNKLFLNPNNEYTHTIYSDEESDNPNNLRTIAIDHYLGGIKTSTTYYRLVCKEANTGLIG